MPRPNPEAAETFWGCEGGALFWCRVWVGGGGEACAGEWGVEKPTGVRVAVAMGVFLQLLLWTLGTLRAPLTRAQCGQG